MNKPDKLFAEFPAISKAEWIAQLERELKGRLFTDLQWQLEDEIRLDPFYQAEDFAEAPEPLFRKAGNSWEVGEYVFVNNIKKANEQALAALAGGVHALFFQIKHEPTLEELGELLRDIDLSIVSVHFAPYYPGKNPVKIYRLLLEYFSDKGDLAQHARGSIDFDPLLDWSDPPLDDLAKYIGMAKADLPNFSVLQIDAKPYHGGPEDTSRELALAIAKGSEYLAQMEQRGVAPAEVNRRLQFSMAVSTSYFVEIAKLRALRSLWANVLAAYGVKEAQPTTVVGHLAPETQQDDANTNRIKAATQAMSAIIGGVDRFYVLPADADHKEPSSAMSYRLARNVQHLLKLESFFDKVVDPAAGSYYVEKLTDALAEAAWKQFQEIEAGGGFLTV
jgi:methylmalonyl-CoA mutase